MALHNALHIRYFVLVLNTETPWPMVPTTSLRLLLLLAFAALPTACVPEVADDDDSSAANDDDDALDLFAVEGTWLQPDGGAVTGIAVTVSTEFCIADITDDAGGFRVEDVSPGPKRLITYGSTAEYRWPSVAFAFVAPDDGADFGFAGAMVLPPLDAGVPVDLDATEAQSIVLGSGAELSIEPGALTLAPLTDPVLRSGVLDPADAAFFADLPVATLAVFAVEPILSRFAPAAQLAVPLDGVAAGDSLGLWSIDYESGLFVREGTLLQGDDGVARTVDGGITNLGWHAVTPLETR